MPTTLESLQQEVNALNQQVSAMQASINNLIVQASGNGALIAGIDERVESMENTITDDLTLTRARIVEVMRSLNMLYPDEE